MTPEEKWFNRLKRCIGDMPKTVELAVNDGCITLLPKDAVSRAFERDGDIDDFDLEYIDSLQHRNIVTCGESL